MNLDDPLFRLADLAGIHHDYWDIRGCRHVTSAETARAILHALGFAAGNASEIAASLHQLEEEAAEALLPPVHVLRDGMPRSIPLTLPEALAEHRRVLYLADEGAAVQVIQAQTCGLAERLEWDGRCYLRQSLALPALAPGYYRLTLAIAERQAECSLIVAPARCYLPPVLEQGRVFGIAAQLYALVNEHGIGEFSDLAALCRFARKNGAEAVGLNPLHALFADRPGDASPYSPSSRYWLNPLYLDVTAVADFAQCDAAQRCYAPIPPAARVAYQAVHDHKLRVLRLLYEHFRSQHLARHGDPRAAAFAAFCAEGGASLTHFALHAEFSNRLGTSDWRQWPHGLRDPAGPEVRAFAASNREALNFHFYLQWLCAEQLSAAAEVTQAQGMGIGIYGDLAVSVPPDAADVWAAQSLYSTCARIGAPPDALAEHGQDWGLVPLNPLMLRRDGYRSFAALLRANMRYFGALRIDHAMGLERLFWIPQGHDAGQGAYVAYPGADLMGVLALESQRHACLMIGEDLGTVPDGFRTGLCQNAILSYRVLYFEEADGQFRLPADYPELAAACVSTHDLPTLRGFWDSDDIEDRRRAGLLQTPQDQGGALAQRHATKVALLAVLRQAGFIEGEEDPDGPLSPAVAALLHRFLARTPARLLMVQLDDLAGERQQANMPGTVDNFPNWRRRMAGDLSAIIESDWARAILAAVQIERGSLR